MAFSLNIKERVIIIGTKKINMKMKLKKLTLLMMKMKGLDYYKEEKGDHIIKIKKKNII